MLWISDNRPSFYCEEFKVNKVISGFERKRNGKRVVPIPRLT